MEELDIAKRRAMHLIAAREYGRNELIDKLKEYKMRYGTNESAHRTEKVFHIIPSSQ